MSKTILKYSNTNDIYDYLKKVKDYYLHHEFNGVNFNVMTNTESFFTT